MSRSSSSRPRTSRVLLIVLGLTVAIGVLTFASRYRQNTAAAPVAPAPAQASDALKSNDIPPVAVARSSATKPTTTAPTTKPAKPQALSATRPAVALSSKPLIDAEAEADTGRPLKARDIYSAALISNTLSLEETRLAKERLAALNETIVFSRERFDADSWAETFIVPSGGVLAKIAKRYHVTPELLLRINGMTDARRLRADQKIKVLRGPMHAVVDKSEFTIDLYFGAPGGRDSSYVTSFRVGLGKDDSTPTGKWLVEPGKKLTNPTYYSPPDRGQGVIDADDPKNPLGEFWIGLTGVDGQAVGKESYGIHGTIEPDSIGTMASMGCIRMLNEDVARVYEMLVEGQSTVVVTE